MYVYKWKHGGKCKAAVYFKKLSLTEATAERQGVTYRLLFFRVHARVEGRRHAEHVQDHPGKSSH